MGKDAVVIVSNISKVGLACIAVDNLPVSLVDYYPQHDSEFLVLVVGIQVVSLANRVSG